jgi:hemolysin activation/secretion protein
MGSRVSPRVFLFLAVALLCMPGLLCAAEEDFLVKKITITGNQVLKTGDLTPIVQSYEGKHMTLTDLQKVAGLITEEYQKRGFVIAKAYVPEQEITDGIVRIGILEGAVGEVRVEGSHKYYSTQFIKKHFDPIMKEKALNQNTLERALLVLNEYPKLNVQATLQAGRDPGTTDIVVKAENSIPVHLTLDYNNFGSKYTSRDRFGATLDIGNVFKEGAILSIRGISGDTPSDMLLGRASYSIPLNTLGTRLAAYYARGNYDVGEDLAVLGMKGKSESWGVSLSHPFIKKRLMSLTAEAGFDWKNTKQYLLDEITSEDKIRSLRAGATFEQTGVSGRTYASAFITTGLGNSFGAMEDNDPYASRQGADNNFTRFNFDAIRLQKFTPSVFLILKGSAQLSLNKLVSSEQFYIGGADSVRGYGPGEFYGDDGYSATAELRVAPLTNKEKFQIAFFIDNGFVSLQSPPAGVRKTQSLTGGGGGIRLVLPYEINIRADLGIPLDPHKTADGKSSMFYFQALKRF